MEPNNRKTTGDEENSTAKAHRAPEADRNTESVYYYDDSTGYEVYREDDELDDNPQSEEADSGSTDESKSCV